MTSGPLSGVLYDERIWADIGSKIGEALYHLLNPRQTSLRAYVDRGFPENQPRGEVAIFKCNAVSAKKPKPPNKIKVIGKRQPLPTYGKRMPHVVKVRFA